MKNIMLNMCLLLMSMNLMAQDVEWELRSKEVVSTAGGTFSNDEMTLQFVIGEVVVGYISGGDLRVSQGFNYPVPKIIIGIEDFDGESTAHVKAYPNPVHDQLLIEFDAIDIEKVDVQLINSLGQACYLESFQLSSNSSISLDVSNLPIGHYILSIETEGHKEVIQRSIIKK